MKSVCKSILISVCIVIALVLALPAGAQEGYQLPGNRQLIAAGNAENVVALAQIASGSTDGIASVALNSDGSLLAYGTYADHAVHLIDLESGEEIGTLEGHSNVVTALTFSPDGTLLASAGTTGLDPRDSSVRVWEVASGTELAVFDTGTGARELAFSADGSLLAGAGGGDPVNVILWDMGELTEYRRLADVFVAVAFSPTDTLIASGSRDNFLHLHDSTTGEESMTLSGHTGWVASIAFSPDGTLIATGSDDKTIHVWDAVTGAPVRTLEGHTSEVDVLMFNGDGSLLASLGNGLNISKDGTQFSISLSGEDQMVRLWDVESGQELARLEAEGGVSSVAFSADSTLIATGDNSGQIQLWGVVGEAGSDTATPTSQGQIETSAGVVDITQIASTQAYPIGCNPNGNFPTDPTGCWVTASEGFQIVLIYYQSQGELGDDILNEFRVTTPAGDQTELMMQGNDITGAYIGFAVPESTQEFTLSWADSAELGLSLAGSTGESGSETPTTDDTALPATDATWELTIQEVRQESQIQDIFLSSYFPSSGSRFLVIEVEVKNLVFDAAASLPEGDMLLQGVRLYGGNPDIEGAFDLANVVVEDSQGQTYSVSGFAIGSDMVIAPNLVDFTVAAPYETVVYSFVFDVPQNALNGSLNLRFEAMSPLEVAAGATGTASADSGETTTAENTAQTDVETPSQSEAELFTSEDGQFSVLALDGWIVEQPVDFPGLVMSDSAATLADISNLNALPATGHQAIVILAYPTEAEAAEYTEVVTSLLEQMAGSLEVIDIGEIPAEAGGDLDDGHMFVIGLDGVAVASYPPVTNGIVPLTIWVMRFDVNAAPAFLDAQLAEALLALGSIPASFTYNGNPDDLNALFAEWQGGLGSASIDDCDISVENNVNKRSGPGIDYAIAGTFEAGETLTAVGYATGSDELRWWRLEDGSWVRSDVVQATAQCDTLPVVTP